MTDAVRGRRPAGRGLASSSASPAGSPPTRPASCCAASPSPATTSPSSRRPPRWSSSAPPTWAALSGKPVATDVWTDVHEVPHVRIGQEADLVVVAPGDRRPAGQGRPRAGRRPADQHAAHRPLPGRVRPGDAHRDVGAPRHPGQRRDPARARARSCIEPAEGRLTGADTGKGRLPEPAEIFELVPRACWPAAPPRPTWPAATSSSPPAAPASTSTRCASSATAPPACRATPSPGRPPRGAPQVTLVARQRRAARPGRASSVVRVETTAAAARRRCVAAAADRRRRRDGRRARRLPAHRGQRREDQEGRRRLGAGHRAGPEPRHPGRDLATTGRARAA